MTLVDPRFAAELVTRTGKVLPFDDAGCLAAYVAGARPDSAEIHSLWVYDFAASGIRLEVADAVFLLSDSLRTPMDYHVVALRPGAEADSVLRRLGGRLVPWDSVLRSVAGRSP